MKLLFCLVLPLILTAGAVFGATKSPAGVRKSESATIFREKCSMCHGLDGKGYPAISTPNFTDPKWQAAHSDKELLNAIENGVEGTAMVAFKGKLSHKQIEALLKYVRSLGSNGK